MTLHARDIMVTDFDTVHVEAPVEEAIRKIWNGVVRQTGHKTNSLMVIDASDKLCGVITIIDILYHLRPNVLNLGIPGEELEWEGQLKSLVDRLGGQKVDQIMSHSVMGSAPDDHIMVVLDRMVKNRYRRLPILKNGRPVGIVYISDIFHHLFSHKMKQ